MRAAFVYANPRAALAASVAVGTAPDTGLLGQNHLADLGVDAFVYDSLLRRTTRRPGLVHRLTWTARELTLPWEVGRADVIVTPLASLLPLAARVRRRPSVVLLNINLCTTLARLQGARRSLLARSLRAASAIVCFAAAQREKLLEQVALDPDRVHTVPLGVDDRFLRPAASRGERRVLAVGRDNGRDYRTFVDAMRGVDAPATIVASARNVVGLDLPPNVAIELDVSPARLRDLYADASCVVVPTRSEEFSFGADCSGQTVLLDAMAMARATVITQRATLAEYVDDGETALFVPPEDAPALAGRIEAVLGDEQLRDRLGQAARAAVERSFTTRSFAGQLAPILKEAA
ncbi:MAG TPA: glycosyltransferase family 4 protein [Gaiellaceae bacterium]|nr:glycosyltransferase family 4 protein [Gaiellaceae bacterium]